MLAPIAAGPSGGGSRSASGFRVWSGATADAAPDSRLNLEGVASHAEAGSGHRAPARFKLVRWGPSFACPSRSDRKFGRFRCGEEENRFDSEKQVEPTISAILIAGAGLEKVRPACLNSRFLRRPRKRARSCLAFPADRRSVLSRVIPRSLRSSVKLVDLGAAPLPMTRGSRKPYWPQSTAAPASFEISPLSLTTGPTHNGGAAGLGIVRRLHFTDHMVDEVTARGFGDRAIRPARGRKRAS